jgi:periplasmic divalent cation tolerance protein
MRSIYWWQGRVEEAAETVLILKTVDTNLTALIERVEALHPYETPCVTAFKVEDGARGYLDWIQAETRSQT